MFMTSPINCICQKLFQCILPYNPSETYNVPYYTNIKMYINQSEFGSYVNISRAEKVRVNVLSAALYSDEKMKLN